MSWRAEIIDKEGNRWYTVLFYPTEDDVNATIQKRANEDGGLLMYPKGQYDAQPCWVPSSMFQTIVTEDMEADADTPTPMQDFEGGRLCLS